MCVCVCVCVYVCKCVCVCECVCKCVCVCDCVCKMYVSVDVCGGGLLYRKWFSLAFVFVRGIVNLLWEVVSLESMPFRLQC